MYFLAKQTTRLHMEICPVSVRICVSSVATYMYLHASLYATLYGLTISVMRYVVQVVLCNLEYPSESCHILTFNCTLRAVQTA